MELSIDWCIDWLRLMINDWLMYLLIKVDGKRCQFKDVAKLLRAKGIDLDHNRFLILQVQKTFHTTKGVPYCIFRRILRHIHMQMWKCNFLMNPLVCRFASWSVWIGGEVSTLHVDSRREDLLISYFISYLIYLPVLTDFILYFLLHYLLYLQLGTYLFYSI